MEAGREGQIVLSQDRPVGRHPHRPSRPTSLLQLARNSIKSVYFTPTLSSHLLSRLQGDFVLIHAFSPSSSPSTSVASRPACACRPRRRRAVTTATTTTVTPVSVSNTGDTRSASSTLFISGY
ncbi:hypothetical protein E2C01_090929 [Portunus trituberculatus]|uniref:Uncharacterized protein n=1 Tax=Portunus trituberculatus TaxID=210409 RepID=A0A5B7JM68_PORTR|nr:hypothetical protein [Portunus trituberculatus]